MIIMKMNPQRISWFKKVKKEGSKQIEQDKKLTWQSRWWHEGNLFFTLEEFEEDTKWIHVISARYISLLDILVVFCCEPQSTNPMVSLSTNYA